MSSASRASSTARSAKSIPYDPSADPTLTQPPLPVLFPPFHPPLWNSANDSLRGGLSNSRLSFSSPDRIDASPLRFTGSLYTALLGAGFASHHRTFLQPGLDLSSYTHLCLTVTNKSDGPKTLTVVLRDDIESEIAFEANIRLEEGGRKEASLRWSEFIPHRRGKEVPGKKLDTTKIRRVGLMVRSFFGKSEQEGAFCVEVEKVEVEKNADGSGEEGMDEEDGEGVAGEVAPQRGGGCVVA